MKGLTCIENKCGFKNDCPIIKHFYEKGRADERAKLLDKVAERFIEKYDLKYGQSEKFREMLNEVIAELKAEVSK